MPSIISMFQDGDNGSLSSKRVVTFLAFVFCSIAFFANLFFGMQIKEYMFEGMMMIAIAGLGVTVVEKFGTKTSYQPTNYKNPMQPTYYKPINRVSMMGTPIPRQYDREL